MGCVACRSHCEDCSDNGLSFGGRARQAPVRAAHVLVPPTRPQPAAHAPNTVPGAVPATPTKATA